MPQGNTKINKVQKSIKSKTIINPDAKMKNLTGDPEGIEYRCICCGYKKHYKKQKGNFYTSSSPLFEGNNGYIPLCRDCCENYFSHLKDVFSGNEEKALDRICAIYDWYYNDNIAAASRKITEEQSRLASYISKLNLKQNKELGTTYLDTIKDRSTLSINTLEDLEELNEVGEKTVSKSVINKWGFGYEPEEYSLLQEHYKMLTTQFINADAVQDALIKDLCIIKVIQNRAMKSGNTDSFDKSTKLYHSTLRAGGLKTRSETDGADNESACWGNFTKMVEQYNPAEIYKDKLLFKDVDEIESYFKRFILRPIKNFFTGTRVQDDEFNILVGDEDVKQRD